MDVIVSALKDMFDLLARVDFPQISSPLTSSSTLFPRPIITYTNSALYLHICYSLFSFSTKTIPFSRVTDSCV